MKPERLNKIVEKENLETFNLLDNAVWVFDIDNKAMWWANTVACKLWDAESLESLLQRDFCTDMSESTSLRLQEYKQRFSMINEPITEDWTFYPNGKPMLCYIISNGIMVRDNGEARLMMLCEAQPLTDRLKQIEAKTVRGVEILRNLPIAAEQLNSNGEVLLQNPEAAMLFGPYEDTDLSDKMASKFLDRFVNQDLGHKVMKKVMEKGEDTEVEAFMYTLRGRLWFNLKIRRSRDSLTGECVMICSSKDISELVHARKEAETANMERLEFIAVMAHEIRTPLFQVNGFIDLLYQSQLDGKQKEYCAYLQESSMHLMTVINDLLDFTKLDQAKMKIEKIPFEPRDVVHGAISVVALEAHKKQLEIVVNQIPEAIPMKVLGDPTRLRQLLHNFLHNAVKFTTKGKITVDVSLCDIETLENSETRKQAKRVQIEFSVADTGIGLSKQQSKEIFKKYRQADATVSRKYGGTGLGLAICKALVDTMGGDIGVESELGKGSKFWFRLQYEIPGPGNSSVIEVDLLAPEYNLQDLNILVVEDNLVNQKLISALLKRMKHKVACANNGAHAIEMVAKMKYDLILMDIQMPVMNGFEATKKIRDEGISTPIIGLTADYTSSNLSKYLDAGMNECLAKPLRTETLVKAIYQHTNTESLPCTNET